MTVRNCLRKLLFVLLFVSATLMMPAVALAALPALQTSPICPEPPCFAGDGDQFTGSDEDTAGGSNGSGAGPVSSLRTETKYVATCSGNTVDGGADVQCGAALNFCPVEGQVRFWVYRRTVDTRIPGHDPPFERDSTPPYVCLSLDAPEIDPAVAIPAIVNRDFQRVVVLKGVPEVSPEPDTLVNIDTIFSTSSPESYDIQLMIAGQPVVITATVSRWTWYFGDGATDSTTVEGSQGRVVHEYRQSGARSAYLVIEWSGTFQVGGGPVQPVNGTATTTGDPVTVEVRQARTELVAG